MPRVDLYCRYTAFSSTPTLLAPGREVWLPILEVGIAIGKTAVRVPALVDSGADTSLFGLGVADALGFDWRAAPASEFRGVGSTGNIAYVTDVQLSIPEAQFSWTTRIGFCNAADQYGLSFLGYAGFFDTFEVKFRGRQKDFTIFRP